MRAALLCLLLSATAVTAAPAPFAKPARRNALDQIRGTWGVVERRLVFVRPGRRDRQVCRLDSPRGHTVTINAYRLLWRAPGADPQADAIRVTNRGFELIDARLGSGGLATFRREGEKLTLTLSSEGADGYSEAVYVLRRER